MEKLESINNIKPGLEAEEEQGQITINEMYERAADYLEKNAINPDSFVEIYGKETVDADKAKAAALKAKIFENKTIPKGLKLATILEAVVTENVGKNDWLGKKTEARPAAPFDDCKNGIDTLIIFKKDGGFEKYMGLVMDATFNPSEELRGKFNKIRGEIVRGTLGAMKYFESENIKGKMSQIPKVVVGVAAKTIKELGKYKVENQEKEISEHPAQFQILEEIAMQLKIFAEYARSQPNDTYYKKSDKDIRAEMVKIYEEAHDLLSGILEQRRAAVKDKGGRDQMFRRIKNEAEKLLTQDRN